jgi:hypothetical protein
MKNVTWVLFLSAICILPLSAQSIYLTPRAGLNLATITNANATSKPGLNFGVSGEYVSSVPHLAAVAGLFYSMQGADLKDGDINPEHNYLNIPLLLKYRVQAEAGENQKGLSFFAGPQFDIKAVGNKVGYDAEYSGILLSDDMSRTFGMSAVIGAEYLLDVGLVLSANVNIGLSNKAKERFLNYGTWINSKGSHKDMVVQINFGYRFSIF